MSSTIQPHNLRAAAVWSRGGKAYEEISRGIADAIEHCVHAARSPARRARARSLHWHRLDVPASSRDAARPSSAPTSPRTSSRQLACARSPSGLDIEYQLADAERMPFGDATFDAVVSTFGVMFAGNPEAAASELARVVRPGGRIALSTWAPDGNVFGMFQVMRAYMPAPPSPAPPSPFAWGRPERVRELLGDAFDLRFENGTSFYREPSPEAAWHTFSTGYGPTRTLYENLDDERREALRNDFIAFHAGFANDLGICVPREYCITIGTRRRSCATRCATIAPRPTMAPTPTQVRVARRRATSRLRATCDAGSGRHRGPAHATASPSRSSGSAAVRWPSARCTAPAFNVKIATSWCVSPNDACATPIAVRSVVERLAMPSPGRPARARASSA